MTKAKKPDVDYETLKTELDTVLADLQRDDLDIDRALELYERGLALTRQLDTYLKAAENKINELKAQFDNDSA